MIEYEYNQWSTTYRDILQMELIIIITTIEYIHLLILYDHV